MARHVKGARSVPVLPPRRPLAHGLEHPKSSGQTSLAIPVGYRLTVITSSGVYVCDYDGMTEIFHSDSEGIVAAQRLANDRKMLAVADSQVVVLHGFEGDTQRSYKLRGSEVNFVP